MSNFLQSDYEVVQSKAKVFYQTYERKEELQHQTHYCPGCGHGVVHIVGPGQSQSGLDRAGGRVPVVVRAGRPAHPPSGAAQMTLGRQPLDGGGRGGRPHGTT